LKNIFAGYVMFRGTWLMHLPLFILMVTFIKRPDADNDNFTGGLFWWWMAVTMHVVLGYAHFHTQMDWPNGFAINVEAFKVMAILIQVLNLITALTLFSRAPPYDQLTTEEQELKTWLLIEITYVISLVAATMIHLLLRSLERPKLTLEYEHERDRTVDYLGSEDPQLMITIFIQPLSPIIAHLFID